jgi:hypothetical protein
MRTVSKSFILGFLITPITPNCLHSLRAQTANAPVANAATATTAPFGQAPDDATKKIAELVHAGKYAEAQQLTTGLLVAYPDDQRLIKAKALIEKLLAPAALADAGPASSQPIGNRVSAEPASLKLTGMDKVEYNSLIELARQAQQQTADLEQQKASLKQFMDRSGVFLQKCPDQMLLWQLRAASALSLDDPMAGYEAGQKLLAAGAAESNDPNLQQLLSKLNLKGWLDKKKVDGERKRQADNAEAARLKMENDKYTFPVQREYAFHFSGSGRLTVNENDAAYDGPDGNNRFSKDNVREITVNYPRLRFSLKDGKSFSVVPDDWMHMTAPIWIEKTSLLMNAIVERWQFVATEGDTSFVKYSQKKVLKPPVPTQ